MKTPTTNPLVVVLLTLVVSLLAASCGDDTSDSTTSSEATTTTAGPVATTAATTPTTETTTTTTAATTTTAETTTTTASTTTTTVATTTTIDVNTLAEGSGCTPGGALGDGTWFGYVDAARATELDFDLACWFTGAAAAQAAAEDGEESPPPNDYYVRNQNPLIRTITVAPAAEVSWMPNPADLSTQTVVTYADWLTGRGTRSWQPGVWLTIVGGEITFIEEQYVP